MTINLTLLESICKAPGVSGFEIQIRELILKELEGLADEIQVDNMGNVSAIVKGKDSSKKTMAAAHMDEIGFIVTHIDDNGFVRFQPLGGFDPKTLTAQRVLIHGKNNAEVLGVMGCMPIHIMTAKEREAPLELGSFFIDTGLSKKELEEIIELGSPITREREFVEMGKMVNVKSLDNRASVFILLETLRSFKEKNLTPAYDFYAVFTVQEEVGLRGAKTSTLAIQPDFAFGLDVTIAADVPGVEEHKKITSLGKGAAIKILDGSVICDYRMVAYMKQLAKKHNIPWQVELLPAGGTDTAGLQQMTGGGSIAGAVSLPTRYLHQVIEMAHQDDFSAAIDLLTNCVCELDSYNWEF